MLGLQLLTTELCKCLHLPQAHTAGQWQSKKQCLVCESVENPFSLLPLTLVKVNLQCNKNGVGFWHCWHTNSQMMTQTQQGEGFGE